MADMITRWDPFREPVTLREAMDRLFEDSWVPARRRMGENGRHFRLPLDAYVTPDEIVVLANMPGVKPEAVEITLKGDTLTIKAERPSPIENVEYVMQERPHGTFIRTLNINVPVDSDKAEGALREWPADADYPQGGGRQAATIRLQAIPANRPTRTEVRTTGVNFRRPAFCDR
jgi:HSP20 family protein